MLILATVNFLFDIPACRGYTDVMNILEGLFPNSAVFSIAIIAVSLVVSLLLYFVIMFLISPLEKKTILNKFKIQPSNIKAPLRSLLPALCLLSAVPVLKFDDAIVSFLSGAFGVWLIASLGWFLIRMVHTVRESFLSLYDINTPDNLKARSVYTQVRVIENIMVALIIFITVAAALMSFERVRQIGTGLLASAGMLGIVLGFAAQKTLGNFIAGIQIAFAQPIRLDDVVIVENEWGWIEEITLTYVVVRIWDLRRLVLPISYFVENPFQNWTRKSSDILGSVFIYADYTVPVEKIRQELTNILEKSPHWDKKVNVLQVTNASERTIELRALMSALNSPAAWNLRCEVREKLLTFLQKNFPEGLPKTRIELDKTTPDNIDIQ